MHHYITNYYRLFFFIWSKIIKKGDTVEPTSFHPHYLEYTETGQKFEANRQLALTKRAIATAEKPIYLVVYVNRMVPTPDVVTFPYLLSRRSFKNPEMTVIGVYVGCRGKNTSLSSDSFIVQG